MCINFTWCLDRLLYSRLLLCCQVLHDCFYDPKRKHKKIYPIFFFEFPELVHRVEPVFIKNIDVLLNVLWFLAHIFGHLVHKLPCIKIRVNILSIIVCRDFTWCLDRLLYSGLLQLRFKIFNLLFKLFISDFLLGRINFNLLKIKIRVKILSIIVCRDFTWCLNKLLYSRLLLCRFKRILILNRLFKFMLPWHNDFF